MPWKECNHMDERIKFIGRMLDGEKISALCEVLSLTPSFDCSGVKI